MSDHGEEADKEAKDADPVIDDSNVESVRGDHQQEEQLAEQQEEEDDQIHITDGPFTIRPLIHLVPKEFEYTSFDAFENNLYLGTSTGDMLHYFEMEQNNYMLVSQTKFEVDVDKRIDKMIVLPQIERCLVLSDGFLQLFLLPEFAPVPNVDRLEGINDFNVIKFSDKSKRYRIHVFSDDGVKLMSVNSNDLTIMKTYPCKPVVKACNHNRVVMAAKGNNYEIIDLKSGNEIPLFRISEMSTDLPPVISSFSPNEFLVTCGSSREENAMALVVNHDGDITQGTIVLDKYPDDILVQLPFVIVNYGTLGLHVYKMEMNTEPTIVQKIFCKNKSKICIAKTTNTFSSSSSDDKSATIEKLRLVPLLTGNYEFRLEQERVYVDKIFKQTTSLAVYGTSGIFLLNSHPFILEFNDFSESMIDKIEEHIVKGHGHEKHSPYQELEITYLKTMYLLLLTFHSASINKDIAKSWCDYAIDVDMRLFLYLCDFTIYGDVWIPNGLLKFVQESRKLKLKNMFQHFTEIVAFMRLQLKTRYAGKLKDSNNILKSFDMVLFKNNMRNNIEIDVNDYEISSLPEIVAVLQKKPSENYRTLLQILKKLGRFEDCVQLLRDQKQFRELSEFLLKNVEILTEDSTYKEQDLVRDIVTLFNDATESNDEEPILNNVLSLMKKVPIPLKELIEKIKSSSTKVLMLEKLGTIGSAEKEFLLDYYVAQLQKTMDDNGLWELLTKFTTTYSQNIDYNKPNIKTYLEVKIRNNSHFTSFVSISDKIDSIAKEGEKEKNLEEIYAKIKKIDVSHILSLLLFDQREVHHFFGDNLLNILMALNDFEGIENLVDKDNLQKVMNHYLELTADMNSPVLVQNLLKQKIGIVTDYKQLIKIIEMIPPHYSFATLFDTLFPVIRKIDGRRKDQEIKKALLRQQINLNNRIIKDISAE